MHANPFLMVTFPSQLEHSLESFHLDMSPQRLESFVSWIAISYGTKIKLQKGRNTELDASHCLENQML